MPAVVDADDGRRYVVKLRGAGQGVLALVAEVIAGELARTLGLRVPRIALVELDPAFAKNEPDAEIQDLFRASSGLNVGLEFLPEAITFDLAAGDRLSAEEAALTVWLDAYTLNVDRTPRNPNLLRSQRETWLIDHGASLYPQHHWATAATKVSASFSQIREHVLLGFVQSVDEASTLGRERLIPEELERIVDLVPRDWLVAPGDDASPAQRREDYLDFLLQRLQHATIFEQEIRRACSL